MSKRKWKKRGKGAKAKEEIRAKRKYLYEVKSDKSGSIIVEMGPLEYVLVSLAKAVPKVLGLERGKTTMLMQAWADAEAIARVRARIREEEATIRAGKMESDAKTGRTRWHRHSVPDLDNRSVLIGSHGTTDPENGTVSALITYKDENGSYRIASETWLGGWEKKDGEIVRKDVKVDDVEDPSASWAPRSWDDFLQGKLPEGKKAALTFKTQDEAQRAALMAIDSGHWVSEYKSLRDESRTMRKADRLSKWEHQGADMKRKYARPKKQKPTGKSVRVPSPQK